MRTRPSHWFIAASVASLLLLCVACGNQDDPEDAEDESTSTASTPAGQDDTATANSTGTPAEEPSTTPPPPPPIHLQRWVDHGVFVVPEYDNRSLSDQEKRANPVFDPRWPPFLACMDDAGFAIDRGPDGTFGQDDMNAFVARLNTEYPDTRVNQERAAGEGFNGLAGAFIGCANEWLTLTTEELEEHGLELPTVPGK